MAKKTIAFTSDSQLLAELGERLIATPQIALSELVKNAYDADATNVHVWLDEDGTVLNVKDDGHGMAETEFRRAWMRIASSHKLLEEVSRYYKRPLTGSKGVGRFAVRLLGDELLLETSPDGKKALRARFPWQRFETGDTISSHPITYWTNASDFWSGLSEDDVPKGTGTLLRISGLRHTWDEEMLADISGYLLQIQTPGFASVDSMAETDSDGDSSPDPGFKIYCAAPGEETEQDDPTTEILERAAITLHARVRKQRVTYKYSFRSGRKPLKHTIELPDKNLIGHLSADIRFLPYRAGIFAKLRHFDGRKAAGWVRKNSGIGVYDRGFRIPPYGMPNDDWVRLARDVAARRRDWDSYIAEALVPMPEKSPPASEHPALHLPGNHQVIGFVSLKTHNPSAVSEQLQSRMLQASMDRQGFVHNDGYRQLYNVVRGGMEIMAALDLDEELRRKKEGRKKEADELHDQLDTAVEDVENSRELPPTVRKSLVRQLRRVQRQAQRTEDAADEAEVAVETLGLLGVISAFMTHEMTTMIRSVSKMKTALRRVTTTKLRKADREPFAKALAAAEHAFDALVRHRDYVQTFASNVRAAPSSRYKARVAIGQVVEQFQYFTTPRDVAVEQLVAPNVLAPPMPMSVYSGLILNLYTNALKAVLAKRSGTDKRILIEADNDGDMHVVRISDTGRGVPDALQSRVFDPLFSASDEDGPLGPGMGLGLYIVKRVVRSYNGKARLVAPADGYTTTFELRFKNG